MINQYKNYYHCLNGNYIASNNFDLTTAKRIAANILQHNDNIIDVLIVNTKTNAIQQAFTAHKFVI